MRYKELKGHYPFMKGSKTAAQPGRSGSASSGSHSETVKGAPDAVSNEKSSPETELKEQHVVAPATK